MKNYSTGEVIARRQIDGMDSEDWVPADVAQRLYEMLEIAIADGPAGYIEWIDAANEALAEARGEHD